MQFVRMIWELATDWFRRDRVRVSPASGRLLALRAGDRFIFQDDEFVVDSRSVEEDNFGREIIYRLDGSCGASVLRIFQDVDLVVNAEIEYADSNTTVFESEVVLVGAS
jgi:hypothetical protein